MRQPKWTIDEVILAVDTYFYLEDTKQIRNDNPLLIELSNTLKSLPIHYPANQDDTFRNLNGVHMILSNIASIDTAAKYGLRNSSSLQKAVYNYYKQKKRFLHDVAAAIKACLPLPFSHYEAFEQKSNCFMAGNILFLYHRFIEEQSKEVIVFKKDSNERKRSICSVCSIDLQMIYGQAGCCILEYHYAVNVSKYYNGMQILPGKFIAICPTCHKLAHSAPLLFEKEPLKDAIIAGGNVNV